MRTNPVFRLGGEAGLHCRFFTGAQQVSGIRVNKPSCWPHAWDIEFHGLSAFDAGCNFVAADDILAHANTPEIILTSRATLSPIKNTPPTNCQITLESTRIIFIDSTLPPSPHNPSLKLWGVSGWGNARAGRIRSPWVACRIFERSEPIAFEALRIPPALSFEHPTSPYPGNPA